MKPTTVIETGRNDRTVEVREVATVLELQAIGAGHTYRYLEGRAVPYDTWANTGMFMEAHAAGSLKQSTSAGTGQKLPLLMFHDHQSLPVGVSEKWTHSPDGLDGVWRLNDSPEAQRAAAAAERGELTGLSIGFQPKKSRWEFLAWDDYDPASGPDHMDRVAHLESRLLEVSITSIPVYAGAQVSMVRSADGARDHAAYMQFRAARLGNRPAAEFDRWRARVDALLSEQH